jgi:hypothetical protein
MSKACPTRPSSALDWSLRRLAYSNVVMIQVGRRRENDGIPGSKYTVSG